MKTTYISCLMFGLLFIIFPTQGLAAEGILGMLEGEAKIWGQSNGYTLVGVETGTTGCLKGKKYVKFSKAGHFMYAIKYHPIYQEATGAITQVVLEYAPPVGIGKARGDSQIYAPIVKTRPPTHKQKIKPDKSDPCISDHGGVEERYTTDFILEFHYAPGGKVKQERIYNDYIR